MYFSAENLRELSHSFHESFISVNQQASKVKSRLKVKADHKTVDTFVSVVDKTISKATKQYKFL